MNLESGLMMKNKKGFTLIELLAVIVILGILLSISITAVNKIRKKQEIENKLNVLSGIFTGAKSYIADHPEFWNSNSNYNDEDWSTGALHSDGSRALYIDDIGEYADFDKSKYPEWFNRSMLVKTCENSNKYEMILLYATYENDSHVYNYDFSISDCGCEEQKNNAHSFKFCDAYNEGAGWDINGKYYDSTGNNVSGKDINFEK